MRNLKREIAQCMSGLAMAEDHTLTACFVFPDDFIGFQGHFPSNKILPGICQIQCVVVMLEGWGKKRVMLKEIVQAKFLASVFPSEELTCVCGDIGDTNGVFTLKASFSKSGQKVAGLKLKVVFGQEIEK